MCFTAFPLIITATFDWDLNYKAMKEKDGKKYVIIYEKILDFIPYMYKTG